MEMISKPLKEMYTFPAIRGITEEFIINNPGNIPVYGGRKTGIPIGYVADDIDEVKYFENCLAWNRQGSVGYVFYHDHKFTTTDDHRPMFLKKEYTGKVLPEYARVQIENALLSHGFRWGKTAGISKIKDIFIDIPYQQSQINIGKQKEFIDKYNKISIVKNKLLKYLDILDNSLVIVSSQYKQLAVSLEDEQYFSIMIGKRVLKKDILEKGIPIYSSNVKIPFGYASKSNLKNFDKDSILWGIDGNFIWNLIPKNKIFEATDHCGRLQILNESILPEYVYYTLNESASSYGFNRSYRASLNNIKEVTFSIPITEDGKFDVIAQKEMISRYKKIEITKTKIIRLIKQVVNPSIDINII